MPPIGIPVERWSRKSVFVPVVGVVRAGGPEWGRVWVSRRLSSGDGCFVVSRLGRLGGRGHEGWTGFSVLAWGEVGQPGVGCRGHTFATLACDRSDEMA